MRIFPRRSALRVLNCGLLRGAGGGLSGQAGRGTSAWEHKAGLRDQQPGISITHRSAAQPHSLPVIFVSLPSCRTFPRQVGRWCVCTALRKPICPDELLTEAPGLGQTVKLSVQIMFNADVPWITIGLVGCFFSLILHLLCGPNISLSLYSRLLLSLNFIEMWLRLSGRRKIGRRAIY